MSEKTWHNPSDEKITRILKEAKTIAVVGCSPKPDRTSHQIAAFLLDKGYRMIPVHPKADAILGQKVYASLSDIPEPVDIVDVFRRSEFTAPIAAEAAAIHAGALWLQQGIISEDARKIANAAGMPCIMDRCIAVMHRLFIR